MLVFQAAKFCHQSFTLYITQFRVVFLCYFCRLTKALGNMSVTLSMNRNSRSRMLKVVLLGDGKVGKSSLMNRYVSNKFDSHSFHTIGVEFLNKEVVVDDQSYTIQVSWLLCPCCYTDVFCWRHCAKPNRVRHRQVGHATNEMYNSFAVSFFSSFSLLPKLELIAKTICF